MHVVSLVGISEYNIAGKVLFGAFVERVLRCEENLRVIAVNCPFVTLTEKKFRSPVLEQDDHARIYDWKDFTPIR